MNKSIFSFFLALCLLASYSPVQAQDSTPIAGPVYIIQPGDSLSSIATKFGVTLTELMTANNITDANSISAGAQVIIPGLEGINGILNTEIVGYGDSLSSLSRRNQIDLAFLRKLNHITSPSELYAGVPLIIPQKENFVPLNKRIIIEKEETLLEAAVREDSDPWSILQSNNLSGSWQSVREDVLFSPTISTDTNEASNGLPPALVKVTVNPLPLTQGSTTVIKVFTLPGVKINGAMVDRKLNFFTDSDGSYVALQGTHAMLTPGPYPLRLDATLPDGSKQSFEQMVIVKTPITPYPFDPMLSVDPATIDPGTTGPETKLVETITAPATPQKMWQGVFLLPVDPIYCLKSWFGNRRAYNGGEYESFHGGLDFGICSPIKPFDIYSPADGVVVYTGELIVRGNATIIDHGWGVYTGYWHQEKILVNVGDHVSAGQLIGQIGKTGRVTGPHLHWEIWVNGVQVNPSDWLNAVYP